MNSPAPSATLLLLALLLTFGSSHSRARSADDALSFSIAMAAHQSRQWLPSYAAFTVLAGGGHAQSARVAAQMHHWVPRLCGVRFAATIAELTLWQQRAADQAATATEGRASTPGRQQALLPGSGQ